MKHRHKLYSLHPRYYNQQQTIQSDNQVNFLNLYCQRLYNNFHQSHKFYYKFGSFDHPLTIKYKHRKIHFQVQLQWNILSMNYIYNSLIHFILAILQSLQTLFCLPNSVFSFFILLNIICTFHLILLLNLFVCILLLWNSPSYHRLKIIPLICFYLINFFLTEVILFYFNQDSLYYLSEDQNFRNYSNFLNDLKLLFITCIQVDELVILFNNTFPCNSTIKIIC